MATLSSPKRLAAFWILPSITAAIFCYPVAYLILHLFSKSSGSIALGDIQISGGRIDFLSLADSFYLGLFFSSGLIYFLLFKGFKKSFYAALILMALGVSFMGKLFYIPLIIAVMGAVIGMVAAKVFKLQRA